MYNDTWISDKTKWLLNSINASVIKINELYFSEIIHPCECDFRNFVIFKKLYVNDEVIEI